MCLLPRTRTKALAGVGATKTMHQEESTTLRGVFTAFNGPEAHGICGAKGEAKGKAEEAEGAKAQVSDRTSDKDTKISGCDGRHRARVCVQAHESHPLAPQAPQAHPHAKRTRTHIHTHTHTHAHAHIPAPGAVVCTAGGHHRNTNRATTPHEHGVVARLSCYTHRARRRSAAIVLHAPSTAP